MQLVRIEYGLYRLIYLASLHSHVLDWLKALHAVLMQWLEVARLVQSCQVRLDKGFLRLCEFIYIARACLQVVLRLL